MKKTLLAVFVLIFSIGETFAQSANDYRSATSGPWNALGTWERFDGASWLTPTVTEGTPNNTDGIITIRDSHIITVENNTSVNQTFVEEGGTIVINSGVTLSTSTSSTAAGDEITINSGGLLDNKGVLSISGILPVVKVFGTLKNSNSIIGASSTKLTFENGGTYQHDFDITEGTIPLAGWKTGSTCLITGYTTNANPPLNISQTFYNLTWDCSSQNEQIDLQGKPTDITGSFTIHSTGGGALIYDLNNSGSHLSVAGNFVMNDGVFVFKMNEDVESNFNITGNFELNNGTFILNYLETISAPANLNITGDLNILGGVFAFNESTSPTTINLFGDFNYSSGDFYNSGFGVANFDFEPSALPRNQQFNTTNDINSEINYSVNGNAILEFSAVNFVSGFGTFNSSSNSTIIIKSTAGIANNTSEGNIRVSGLRTFVNGTTLRYSGLAHQVLGNGFPSNVNLEINNASNVALSSSITVGENKTLTLTSGNLELLGFKLTIDGNISSTNGFLATTNGSDLTIGNGNGNPLGIIPFSSTSSQLRHFVMERTNTAIIGQNIEILGSFDLESGELIVNDRILTLSGIIDNTSGSNAGLLSVNTLTHLIINGTGDFGEINFSETGNTLGMLTLNRTPAGAALIGNDLIISDTLRLNNGTLSKDINEELTMGPGSTIKRQASGAISFKPAASSTYNVTYLGSTALVTGLELPSVTDGTLNNLTLRLSNTVTLDKAIDVLGNLRITNGLLNTNNNNIQVKGNFVNNQGIGGFNATTASVTFNGTVAQSLSGTTTFYDVVFSPSLSLDLSGTSQVTNTLVVTSGIINVGVSTLNGPAAVTMSGGDLLLGKSGTMPELTGAYSLTGGTVTFNGSGAQTIRAASYYNLTNATSSEKTLAGNTTITRIFDNFAGGIIDAGSNYLYLSNALASALVYNEANSASYIKGILRREVRDGINYSFPVGQNILQRFDVVFTARGTNNHVNVSFTNGDPTTSAISAINPDGADPVIYERYSLPGFWSLNGVDEVGAQYNLTLYPQGFDYQFNEAYTVVKRHLTSDDWSFFGTAGIPPTEEEGDVVGDNLFADGSIRRNGMTGFSDETIVEGDAITFPIVLNHFNATLVEDHVLVDWATLSETKSSHFIVERSESSDNFKAIGQVESAGNSSDRIDYKFKDLTASHSTAKTLYYRLRQVDVDGKFEIFPIVALDVTRIERGAKLKIHPNPATSEVTVTSQFSHPVEMKVYNSVGKLISEELIDQRETIVNTSNLKRGVYYFKFVTGATVVNERVIIK